MVIIGKYTTRNRLINGAALVTVGERATRTRASLEQKRPKTACWQAPAIIIMQDCESADVAHSSGPAGVPPSPHRFSARAPHIKMDKHTVRPRKKIHSAA